MRKNANVALQMIRIPAQPKQGQLLASVMVIFPKVSWVDFPVHIVWLNSPRVEE